MATNPSRTLLAAALVACLAFAGCTQAGDVQAAGAFDLVILDGPSGGAVTLLLDGVWGLRNATSTWARLVGGNESLEPAGAGASATGTGPAGAYDGLRVILTGVEEGGVPVGMVENGFDLPVAFTIAEGEQTTIEIAFSWPDTLFDSQDGRAFLPALRALRVLEAGEELLSLGSQDIQIGATRAPVARMRVFDDAGLQVFESTFIGESREDPVVANAGNLTFAGSASEALHPGAEIATYEWQFGDGTVLEGITAQHRITAAQNHTVRLTVTDTAGGRDSQSIIIAIKPDVSDAIVQQTYDGTIMVTDSAIDHVFTVDGTRAPDGRIGRLEFARVTLDWDPFPADLDLEVYDGAGTQIGGSGDFAPNPTGPNEQWSQQFDTAPASGDWVVRVVNFAAAVAQYSGTVELRWKVLEADPAYLEWLQSYDDGHDHQH